ncbi:MAG TPA: hypothetical protein VIM02_04545 [Rhizomicrobium sp.]|jgi:hypothetical protein
MSIPMLRRAALAAACSVFALSPAAMGGSMRHPEAQQHVTKLPARKMAPHGAHMLAMAAPGDACNGAGQPFCDALMDPTPGWTGQVFKLAQNYPATAPQDDQPWLKLDPKTQALDYLKSVLAYFYEGNIRDSVEESFDPTKNTVRQWYNAPWQDFGVGGREFIHGLTRERVSLPGELAPTQKSKWNNYAVGFYNAPGGVTIGKVWADHMNPQVSLAAMPEGTVGAKLLYTTATVDEVPYLAGAPEWQAYVYKDVHATTPKETDPRAVTTVRLLQIDIAVKDSRVAGTTGWVFGTFVYGGGPGGPAGSGWTNVAPVGSSWGNDPTYSGTGPVGEQVMNTAVNMPHVGYQGRLNGPVDNPVSSCLSCHSTAEIPRASRMYPASGSTPAQIAFFFRNVPAETPFDNDGQHTSTDYSLQVAGGISNFQSYHQVLAAKTVAEENKALAALHKAEQLTPRNGGKVD